jgi:hypothetical protein
MKTTRNQMRTILENVNNPDMISFTSRTPVDMNQYLDYWITDENGKKHKNPNPTPNPFFETGIQNLSTKFKIITGFDYVKSVNRRLEKEGKEGNFVGGFKNEERETWFDVISKGLVTDKKTHTKYYLRYQYCKDSVIGKPEYSFNGDPIEKRLFESYMKQSKNFYDNQNLENPLMFQVCDLNNILSISMGKEVYELVD